MYIVELPKAVALSCLFCAGQIRKDHPFRYTCTFVYTYIYVYVYMYMFIYMYICRSNLENKIVGIFVHVYTSLYI